MLFKAGWFNKTDSFILRLSNEIRILDKETKTWIKTHDIVNYKKDYMECIRFFVDFKNLGNPFGTGWHYWPCWAYDIINTLNAVDWSKDA